MNATALLLWIAIAANLNNKTSAAHVQQRYSLEYMN
jgi:hypothetical protein